MASSSAAGGLTTTNLEDLQTEEQRKVLETVSQIRKCGLESILNLPQLCVCGDQSSGKSSVLEAITGIEFPRADNLCTRFATEIILRHAAANTITVRIIPDGDRGADDKARIEAFERSIEDFNELPLIIDEAKDTLDLSQGNGKTQAGRSAFAKDVLSIEIEGPTRPHLTLVDIPGLIQSSTKGVTEEDVKVVAGITDHYIKQRRTICLAVVSATNDAANQSILSKVRHIDPDGDRTLGIITKPDRLPSGSGSEANFIELASNEDVFFKLGWHVLKNRSFEQSDCSIEERDASESLYFATSNFKRLPKENVGIDSLRSKLSLLLFSHVKAELPALKSELVTALEAAQSQLSLLGPSRSQLAECRTYLLELSQDFSEICKAAASGHYQDQYFLANDSPYSKTMPIPLVRLRAVIQRMNSDFEQNMRVNGFKFYFNLSRDADDAEESPAEEARTKSKQKAITLNRAAALSWAQRGLMRTRGQELIGNFNPLLIGELFWEQSEKWAALGAEHIQRCARYCESFLENLLAAKCPGDVKTRIWAVQLADKLKARQEAATRELDTILRDMRGFPINYNHYYTDTIHKCRQRRAEATLKNAADDAIMYDKDDRPLVNVKLLVDNYHAKVDSDMENVSCEEALDCVMAIYKVQLKVFVSNVTTQVIERHIVRGIEKIFSPLAVSGFSSGQIEALASEPQTVQRKRAHLQDRLSKLQAGSEIFNRVLGGSFD